MIGTTIAFSPLIFLALEYYNCGNIFDACITCMRDFLWPVAAMTAKCFNASPYQMCITNIGGIA